MALPSALRSMGWPSTLILPVVTPPVMLAGELTYMVLMLPSPPRVICASEAKLSITAPFAKVTLLPFALSVSSMVWIFAPTTASTLALISRVSTGALTFRRQPAALELTTTFFILLLMVTSVCCPSMTICSTPASGVMVRLLPPAT